MKFLHTINFNSLSLLAFIVAIISSSSAMKQDGYCCSDLDLVSSRSISNLEVFQKAFGSLTAICCCGGVSNLGE